MRSTRNLFTTVARAGVLFSVLSWALVFALVIVRRARFDVPESALSAALGTILVVFAPDVLAAWWLFSRLRTDRPRNDARRAAIAFAISAPLTSAVGMVLGELVGGYAEVFLGRLFILPSIGIFIIVLMVLIPNGVVIWTLHPSAGADLVRETGQHEHC